MDYEIVGKQKHPKTITDLTKAQRLVMKKELRDQCKDTSELRWYSVSIKEFSRKDLERMMIVVTEHLRKNPDRMGVIYVLRRLGLHGTEIPYLRKEEINESKTN